MAAHPVVVMDDELLQKLPEKFRDDPRYQRGATLELVPVAQATRQEPVAKTWEAWERLNGALRHADFRLTDDLERERLAELARDEARVND